MKHKHADIIKAWADGAVVERFSLRTGCWEVCGNPTWSDDTSYRVSDSDSNIYEMSMLQSRVQELENVVAILSSRLDRLSAAYVGQRVNME